MNAPHLLAWVVLVLVVPDPPVEVAFSPGGRCSERIVALLGEAQATVRVQAYSFTSKPIAQALIDARKRGVDVVVVLDRSNLRDPHSQGHALFEVGIPVVYDHAHPIAHNKVMVIDDRLVIGGSYNYSAQAERNAENMTILRGESVAGEFTGNWTRHFAHSEPAP